MTPDKRAFEALLRAAINAAVYNGNVHGRGGVVSAEDRKFLADQEAAVLAAYEEAKQPAPFKPTGNPELDAVLLKPDPAFDALVASLPANYWARYDLSAVRLGWHFGRTAAGREEQPVATDLREFLGQIVRMVWIEWAKEQPHPKSSWLAPWTELSEPDREVDRRIGERLYRMGADGLYTHPAPKADEEQIVGWQSCGDCDPCIGGRPDQCAVGRIPIGPEPEADAAASGRIGLVAASQMVAAFRAESERWNWRRNVGPKPFEVFRHSDPNAVSPVVLYAFHDQESCITTFRDMSLLASIKAAIAASPARGGEGEKIRAVVADCQEHFLKEYRANKTSYREGKSDAGDFILARVDAAMSREAQ